MGSVYSDLETQMIGMMGRDDDNTKALLMTAWNWFQDIIASVADWDELETYATKSLTAGTYKYHLTTDWSLTDLNKLYSIKLNDGTNFYPPLEYVTPITWDKVYASGMSSGNTKPSHFTQRGNYILFSCPPESGLTIEIWYFKFPTKVTSTTSVIDYNRTLEGPLVALSMGTAWLALEEEELGDRWLKLGSKMLKDRGIDVRAVVDFKAFSQTRASVSPDYYADPFVKGVR